MSKRLAGPILTAFVLGGVGLILVMNFQTPPPAPTDVAVVTDNARPKPESADNPPAGFREYPIGEDIERNQMKISAVWLPSVQMDGGPAASGSDVIHLEADVRATAGNRHGFAMHEFVPYLTVKYRLEPAGGGPILHEGEMIPMVASDGQHYGTSIDMPRAGKFRLTYAIMPPSSKGMGRHHDPATGVPPWWEPFSVEFAWDYDGPPQVGVAFQP